MKNRVWERGAGKQCREEKWGFSLIVQAGDEGGRTGYGLWRGSGQVLVTSGRSKLTSSNIVKGKRRVKNESEISRRRCQVGHWMKNLEVRGFPSWRN